MSIRLFRKTWVSAIMAFSFVVLGVSGALMLFHIRIPLVSLKLLHIAMGLTFIVIGSIHLLLNWKTFATYLRRTSTVIALVAGILLCVAISLWGPQEPKGGTHFQGDVPNNREAQTEIAE